MDPSSGIIIIIWSCACIDAQRASTNRIADVHANVIRDGSDRVVVVTREVAPAIRFPLYRKYTYYGIDGWLFFTMLN